MQIQKKHKIYAGLVGMALAAWGIDSVFFESSPAAAPAAAAASVEITAPAPQPMAAEKQGDAAGNSKWLSERLIAWAKENSTTAQDVRDVFSPPISWAVAHAPATAPSKTSETVAQDFQRDHHLLAVVLSPSGGSALVDGRLLRVGQSVGAFRLVAVSSGCADFAGPDGGRFQIVIGTAERARD